MNTESQSMISADGNHLLRSYALSPDGPGVGNGMGGPQPFQGERRSSFRRRNFLQNPPKHDRTRHSESDLCREFLGNPPKHDRTRHAPFDHDASFLQNPPKHDKARHTPFDHDANFLQNPPKHDRTRHSESDLCREFLGNPPKYDRTRHSLFHERFGWIRLPARTVGKGGSRGLQSV